MSEYPLMEWAKKSRFYKANEKSCYLIYDSTEKDFEYPIYFVCDYSKVETEGYFTVITVLVGRKNEHYDLHKKRMANANQARSR